MSSIDEESAPRMTREHPKEWEPSQVASAASHRFHQPNRRGGSKVDLGYLLGLLEKWPPWPPIGIITQQNLVMQE